MIKFPCKCGHPFNLTEDQAGALVQCPRCGLLADVPTLSDLANMNPDGTLAFSEVNTAVDNVTAADLHHYFTNKTTDSRGREKDLRNQAENIRAIGVEDEQGDRPSPRYDPVTGELIRPLQFKDDAPMPVLPLRPPLQDESAPPIPVVPIPVAQPVKVQPRSLGYAFGDTRKQVTLTTLAGELMMPANTAVMFFIWLLYVAAFFTTSALASYTERFLQTVWPFLLLNLPMWLILAHAGCTIESIGPDAIDELPRPLRDFGLVDDILWPAFCIVRTMVICFILPVIFYRKLDPANPMTIPIVMTFGGIGCFIFPAVLLTSVTGTTVLNLSPGRVLGVIKECGMGYFVSVLLFVLAAVPSVFYLAGPLLFRTINAGRLGSPEVMLPMVLVSVYFLHFFCWQMGMMYRAGHDQFPWLAQRHVKSAQGRKS